MLKIIIILLCFIVLAVIFSRIKYFLKRLKLKIKIKKIAEKKGIILCPTHTLWFLGDKRKSICDFHLIGNDTVWSVKLFGSSGKRQILFFDQNRNYFFRNQLRLINRLILTFNLDSKKRKLPFYDFQLPSFQKQMISTGDIKQKKILLINPVCYEVRCKFSADYEQIVCPGDEIYNELIIHSLYTFANEIEGNSSDIK